MADSTYPAPPPGGLYPAPPEVEAAAAATATPKYPEGLITADLELVGIDGNAFAILGTVARALRKAGNDEATVTAWMEYATAGDYNQVLTAAMQAVGDI